MVYTSLQTRASARPTLPEGDECEHSQNYARHIITPPCQNRGPAKDERETLWIRPCVGARDANNFSTQHRVLADCEQVIGGVGSRPSALRV